MLHWRNISCRRDCRRDYSCHIHPWMSWMSNYRESHWLRNSLRRNSHIHSGRIGVWGYNSIICNLGIDSVSPSICIHTYGECRNLCLGWSNMGRNWMFNYYRIRILGFVLVMVFSAGGWIRIFIEIRILSVKSCIVNSIATQLHWLISSTTHDFHINKGLPWIVQPI